MTKAEFFAACRRAPPGHAPEVADRRLFVEIVFRSPGGGLTGFRRVYRPRRAARDPARAMAKCKRVAATFGRWLAEYLAHNGAKS